jgi:hypothetical protein
MNFPETFLKGITNKDFIDEDGQVASHLFYFGKTTDRKDDYIEQSIFWKDDEGAIELILTQKKDDRIQFKMGAAVLLLSEIERIKLNPNVKNKLAYERRKQKDNPYHGNLLLKKDTKDPLMKRIAASIALTCPHIISSEKE